MNKFFINHTGIPDPDHLKAFSKLLLTQYIRDKKLDGTQYEISFQKVNLDNPHTFNYNVSSNLHIVDTNKFILSENIEVPLIYFPEVINKIRIHFPHIYEFIEDNKIKKINIKPGHDINPKDYKHEIIVNDINKMFTIIMNPDNAKSMDILVLCELIRKFYQGELDQIDGFLIYQRHMKYFKQLYDNNMTLDVIFDKLTNNMKDINIECVVRSQGSKYNIILFKNKILTVKSQHLYINNLDIKFIACVLTISTLLHKKSFGRR